MMKIICNKKELAMLVKDCTAGECTKCVLGWYCGMLDNDTTEKDTPLVETCEVIKE